MSLIEVKLRPTGPWRVGDRAGDRERVDVVYHSDALYSAVTLAMRALGGDAAGEDGKRGWLEEWLAVTAQASGNPVVRFSSLFPFIGKTRLVAPPKSLWPPSTPGKLYLQGAKLVPLEIVKTGVVEESRWSVDGESGCMLPTGVAAPFRVSLRSAAAVDRLTGATEPHRTACLEFAPNAGWWGVFEVSDPVWEARVKAALRLLADSGFGGERSRGWGRSSEPQFSEAAHLFAPGISALGSPALGNAAAAKWWLLSAYSPDAVDQVDWTASEFVTAVRGGWTESPAGSGAKKQVRLIEEGSVIAAPSLRGRAVDVAPDGFAHPVYRSGIALAMPVPEEIAIRAVTEQVKPQKAAAAPVAVEPVIQQVIEEVIEALPELEPALAKAVTPIAQPTITEAVFVTETNLVTEPVIVSEANVVEEPVYVEVGE